MAVNSSNKLKQGRRLFKAGKLGQALALYQKLLKRSPDSTEVHYGIGQVYKAGGDYQKATAHFNQAIKLGLRDGAVFADNAESMNILYRYGEAENMARAAVALEPGNPAGLRQLIKSLLPQAKYKEALAAGEKLLELSPDSALDRVQTGWAALTLEHYDAAITLAREALELDKSCAGAHYLLSRTYKNVQQWDKALIEAEKAIGIKPDNREYQAQRANMLEHLGRFEEAFEAVKPLVSSAGPRNNLAVLVHARLAKRFGELEQSVGLLEELVAEKSGFVSMVHSALNLLGAAYDSLGRYDKAFAAVERANRIRPLSYNEDSTAHYMQSVSNWFNRDRLSETATATVDSAKPIFIVGMPRSGTSLTETILSRHPEVKAAGETLHLPRLLHQELPALLHSSSGFPECMAALTPEIADQAAALLLDKLGVGEGIRITEKRPMNFMYLGAITRLFPGAKIIHCTRDPLDTGLSCFFANFTSSTELGFSQDLELIGNYYKHYQQMMAHWQEVLPMQIFDVSYEALVRSPETEIPGLLEFCELPWHEDCLSPHKSSVITKTASYNQVRRPINTDSIGRWRLYEQQLAPLKLALGSATTQAA